MRAIYNIQARIKDQSPNPRQIGLNERYFSRRAKLSTHRQMRMYSFSYIARITDLRGYLTIGPSRINS